MGNLEEDLFNAFRYANFSGKSDPMHMIRGLIRNLELTMLNRMKAQIDARVNELRGEQTAARGDDSMDPFVILGVNEHSTKEEVTKAYRDKAHEAHPDKGGSHEQMAKVNCAYEAIKLFKGWK